MNLLSGFFPLPKESLGDGQKAVISFELAMSWGMWDLGSPNQGDQSEPLPPAVEVGDLTTGPPGKTPKEELSF